MLQLQILLLESRRILDGSELAFDGMSAEERMGSEVMAWEATGITHQLACLSPSVAVAAQRWQWDESPSVDEEAPSVAIEAVREAPSAAREAPSVARLQQEGAPSVRELGLSQDQLMVVVVALLVVAPKVELVASTH
jgi:hypothetical protein